VSIEVQCFFEKLTVAKSSRDKDIELEDSIMHMWNFNKGVNDKRSEQRSYNSL